MRLVLERRAEKKQLNTGRARGHRKASRKDAVVSRCDEANVRDGYGGSRGLDEAQALEHVGSELDRAC